MLKRQDTPDRQAVRFRLCLATDSREPSGVGEHMLALATELHRSHDVVVACPPSRGGRRLLDSAARTGVGIKLLDDDASTEAWLVRRGFDLLHIHAGVGWEGHHLSAVGRAAGVPQIVRTEHLPDVITAPAQRDVHAAGVERVDRIICVSEAAASSFRSAGVDPGKIAVVRNGLTRRLAMRSRADVRAELGIGSDQPLALTAARFTPQKDHATLVEALPAILAAHPDFRLALAGNGPLLEACRERAAALGVAGSLLFLGHRADVADLLAAADMFILPSRFEGLPLAVLEAMAAGVPVIATAVGGTNEVVLDGITGRLVLPGHAPALARAVLDLLRNPRAAIAMGLAGAERFGGEFTADRMASDTVRLYETLGTAPAGQHRTVTMAGAARTRVGFIGAGGIAQRHLGVLEGFDDVEIVAFADPAEERAIAAAERFGARSYPDFEAMLAAERLDACFICVPPFAHGAPERAVVAKRLPFFVEKPLALDLATAEDIAALVAADSLVTAVGYHWRYLDTVEEARSLLADNPAQLLSGYWLDSTPPPQWWWKQDQSGGQIMEQTTHIVDLARHLAGEVVQVFGLASHRPRAEFPGLDVATASTASLRFASGAVANLSSTCLLDWNHRVGLHVFADRLALELTDHDLMVDTGKGRPVRSAEGDPVWREDRDFVDAVRGGPNRIRCPYPEALATLRVTLAINRSAATGRAIPLISEPREPALV